MKVLVHHKMNIPAELFAKPPSASYIRLSFTLLNSSAMLVACIWDNQIIPWSWNPLQVLEDPQIWIKNHYNFFFFNIRIMLLTLYKYCPQQQLPLKIGHLEYY